jgi:hypothetical protein
MASIFEPMENAPTKCGPRGTNTPAGEHIGRIMDTEIDAADAYSDRKQDRQAQEVNFKA